MSAATDLTAVITGGSEELNKLMPIILDISAATGIGVQETTSQMIRMYSAGAASEQLFAFSPGFEVFMNKKSRQILGCAALLCTSALLQNTAIAEERNIYMGAPVTLGKAPNSAIANKKLLDRVDETLCREPEILQPAEGI